MTAIVTRSRRAGPPAAEFGARRAIAEAKALVIAREARRRDRQIAEKARLGAAGVVAAMARKKAEGWIAATLGDLLDRHYHCASAASGGETTNYVTLSDDAGATATAHEEWSPDGTWNLTSLYRRINVSPRWKAEVYERKLAVVDGLVTTHATPIESPEGVEVYRATWIRQSRGLSVQSESGAIARHTASRTTCRSPAPEVAVAGLQRLLAAQAAASHARAVAAAIERAAHRAAQLRRLVDRAGAPEVAEVVVRRDDSLRAGNCEPGTDEFIGQFFRDLCPDSSATVGEIARCVGAADFPIVVGADFTLARQLAAACLVAIRRDKQARRRLAAV
ncbi:MAG: hypothetical protein ACYDCI_00440 [Candidatus Limnocylindrales bacterium]